MAPEQRTHDKAWFGTSKSPRTNIPGFTTFHFRTLTLNLLTIDHLNREHNHTELPTNAHRPAIIFRAAFLSRFCDLPRRCLGDWDASVSLGEHCGFPAFAVDTVSIHE